ncbi:MAG: hypothetical protein WBB27_19965, partial [Maribacter sp.]
KVLAIFDNTAKVYRFTDFRDENIIRDSFNGNEYLLVGNGDFMFAYLINGDLGSLQFTYVHGQANVAPDIIMTDNEGNAWNVFGEAISGPREGQVISVPNAMMAQWFSIPAFYDTEIYSN